MKILARAKRWTAAGFTAALPALFISGCGGDNGPDPGPGNTNPTVTSVSVNPSSVIGGSPSQGSVTVNPAPGSAVNVNLSSSSAAAAVPGSVSVAGGATTGSFTVNTTPVGAPTAVTISATLNGTVTTTLNVAPPNVPTASFVVRSLSPALRDADPNNPPPPVEVLPAGAADACPLAPRPGVDVGFDCVFDGSASTAPAAIQRYLWRYVVSSKPPREEESTTPVHRPSESSCGFFGGVNTGGAQFIQMVVELRVRDATGTLSGVVSNQNVRIFPAGQCGYGF